MIDILSINKLDKNLDSNTKMILGLESANKELIKLIRRKNKELEEHIRRIEHLESIIHDLEKDIEDLQNILGEGHGEKWC